MNRKKVGEFARLLKQVEVLLEQVANLYMETELPTEFAKNMAGLEGEFIKTVTALVTICKTEQVEANPLFHSEVVFNLEQIERWADEP